MEGPGADGVVAVVLDSSRIPAAVGVRAAVVPDQGMGEGQRAALVGYPSARARVGRAVRDLVLAQGQRSLVEDVAPEVAVGRVGLSKRHREPRDDGDRRDAGICLPLDVEHTRCRTGGLLIDLGRLRAGASDVDALVDGQRTLGEQVRAGGNHDRVRRAGRRFHRVLVGEEPPQRARPTARRTRHSNRVGRGTHRVRRGAGLGGQADRAQQQAGKQRNEHPRDHAAAHEPHLRPVPGLRGLLAPACKVALPRVQDDRLVMYEVIDHDGIGDVVDERPVAPVGDRPDRAENRGRAIPALGAERTVGARVKQLKSLARGRGRRRLAGFVARAEQTSMSVRSGYIPKPSLTSTTDDE